MRLDFSNVLSQKQDTQAEAEQMPRGSNILTYLSKKSKQAKRGLQLRESTGQRYEQKSKKQAVAKTCRALSTMIQNRNFILDIMGHQSRGKTCSDPHFQ